MPRTCMIAWSALAAAAMPAIARADGFDIRITVACGDAEAATERTEEYPSPRAPEPRTVFEAPAGELVRVEWTASAAGDGEAIEGTVLHFFVVPEEELDQRTVPDLDPERVVVEGALSMDFEPADEATGAFTFRIREPGIYLLRVETLYMFETHGHDHYAAMDLNIQ